MALRFDIGRTATMIRRAQAIRRAVFVEEQKIDEAEEWDGLDSQALHFIAISDGVDVATGRLTYAGRVAKFQRIAVVKPARGKHYGRALMLEMMKEANAKKAITTLKLSAQTSALGFYQRLGFAAYGPLYDDAGIPHRDMQMALKRAD